jgi:antitoxin FitA
MHCYHEVVANLTIRQLDESVKAQLRIRAAHNGRSMEAEARAILKTCLSDQPVSAQDIYTAVRRHIEPLGGVELPSASRGPARSVPDFGKWSSSTRTSSRKR